MIDDDIKPIRFSNVIQVVEPPRDPITNVNTGTTHVTTGDNHINPIMNIPPGNGGDNPGGGSKPIRLHGDILRPTQWEEEQEKKRIEKHKEMLEKAKENTNKLLHRNITLFSKKEMDEYGNEINNAESVEELNSIAHRMMEEKLRDIGNHTKTAEKIRGEMHKSKKMHLGEFHTNANRIMNNTGVDFFEYDFPLEFLIKERVPRINLNLNKIKIPNPENNPMTPMTIREARVFKGIGEKEYSGSFKEGSWILIVDDIEHFNINGQIFDRIDNNRIVVPGQCKWEIDFYKKSIDSFLVEIFFGSQTQDGQMILNNLKDPDEKIRKQAEKELQKYRDRIFTPKDIRICAKKYIENYTDQRNIVQRAGEIVADKGLTGEEAENELLEESERLRADADKVRNAELKMSKVAKDTGEKHYNEINKKAGEASKDEAVDEIRKKAKVKDTKKTLSDKKRQKIYNDIKEQGTLFIHIYEQLRHI